jgi:hypothetical protein
MNSATLNPIQEEINPIQEENNQTNKQTMKSVALKPNS